MHARVKMQTAIGMSSSSVHVVVVMSVMSFRVACSEVYAGRVGDLVTQARKFFGQLRPRPRLRVATHGDRSRGGARAGGSRIRSSRQLAPSVGGKILAGMSALAVTVDS